MICDNEMCFDLTEKHPEEKKKRYLSELASNGINASLYLSVSCYLFILCASKLGHAICTNFSSFKKKKNNSFSESVFKLNTK